MTPKRAKRLLAASSALAAALAAASALILFFQPRWLLARLAQRSGVLSFVNTGRPLVALTIDDGPDPRSTPRILEVLERHGARATFFLIGSRVPGNEALVSRIVATGHELGNHLMEDRPSIRLPPAEFERALLHTHAILSTFVPVRWMRPAGGLYNAEMIRIVERHGYRAALGSVYPYDTVLPWSRFAALHVVANARPGSVIVLHDGGDRGRRTVRALEKILPALADRGLRIVNLSELAGSAEHPQPRE